MATLPDRVTLAGLRHLLRLRRALALAWTNAPAWMALNLVLVVLPGLLRLASVYVLKLLVGALVAPKRGCMLPGATL